MSTATIKIYCDGVLKEEFNVKGEALPQKVTVEITGVSQIKIVAGNVNSYGQYGFANVTVK